MYRHPLDAGILGYTGAKGGGWMDSFSKYVVKFFLLGMIVVSVT